MRSLIVTLGVCVLAAGCALYAKEPHTPRIHPPAAAAPIESPCTDSLYLSLKGKPLEDMTEWEYRYFIQKDGACSEFQRTQAETEATSLRVPATDMANTLRKSHNLHVTLVVVGIAASVLIFAWAI